MPFPAAWPQQSQAVGQRAWADTRPAGPAPLLPNRLMRAGYNQARNRGVRAGYLPGLIREMGRPGVSTSVGTVADALPEAVRRNLEGYMQAEGQLTEDLATNRQHKLLQQIMASGNQLGLQEESFRRRQESDQFALQAADWLMRMFATQL